MDWINGLGLSEDMQKIATFLFVLFVSFFGAKQYVKGKKEQPPKTTEFAVAGGAAHLMDMGPIKELIEHVGLLVQQQVRTNMSLEAHTEGQVETAAALRQLASQVSRLADAYEGELKAEASERQLEEIERRLAERLLGHQPRPPGT